jgi:tetratricopeptide (TPR) repeat protein
MTAAEQRAAEVRARRQPRPPRDPAAEQAKIEARTREEWIDEGDLRAEAAQAATRAAAVPARPKRPRSIDPDASAAIAGEVHDPRRAARLTERLAQAQEALDRERFDEARRIALPLLRELGNVAAVHEVLGLTSYRTGKWKQAVTELEAGQALRPAVELLPVLADAYRALRRWDDVERIWTEVREISPSPDVLAEARIVVAGAHADRGDLKGALRIMGRAGDAPKRVRDHHLRQWYVLGDLHDRAGNPIEAIRYFELVASHDRDFVDVVERLRALGR